MPQPQNQQPIGNRDIARVFEEIADFLEIQGDNPFRIRAYRNASNLVAGLGTSVAEMLANGEDLTDLPGIGDDLAAKIREIVATSTCRALEKLRKQFPPTLTTLLKIPGLGPKRVQTLYRRLDIGTPEQLYQAVHERKIRELPGFGEKTEKIILEALDKRADAHARVALAVARQHAEPLKDYLAKTAGVMQVAIAGSYRRARETIGDIDIVVTAKRGSPVMERLCKYKHVAEVVSRGTTRATVRLASGLQVDMRVVPQVSFGAAMHYFTGSKGHNIVVRRLGQQKRLKINEYGVFRGAKRIAGATEESVFASIGLPFIPPELRENRGEIEASAARRLPALVDLGDIKGDLHVRMDADAGSAALTKMIDAARRRRLSYLALVCEYANGDANRLNKNIAAIDALIPAVKGVALLKGIEVDILENGDLAAPAALLQEFDVVIAAVHSNLDLSPARQTERMLRALDHPRLTILAQPAGTLDADMPSIVRKARAVTCALELSADPARHDLLAMHCRLAKDAGVPIALTSEAARAADLDKLALAVGQARRGWLEAKDVLNTRSFDELATLIKRA